jgi:hypothetical protein
LCSSIAKTPNHQIGLDTLPESASLPSAGGFAERFFSGARQRRLCREPNKKHSAKASLPSAKVKHSAKQFFKPCFGALNEFKLKSF